MGAPSDYLSRTETLFLVATAAGHVDFEKMVYGKIPEDEEEAAKKVFKAFKEYKDIVLNRIGNRGKRRLISRIKNYEPVLQVRSEVKDRESIPIDYWYDMVSYIMDIKCKDCAGKKRCKLRDILWGMHVPEAQIPDGIHTICEYQYKEGDMEYQTQIE